jgi:hypothetical protein
VQASVLRVGNNQWLERFDRVMKAAKQVIVASQHPAIEVYLAYANMLMFGLAKSRARSIDGEVRARAVWDGRAGSGGGTSSALGRWRSCGQIVRAIDPLTLQCQDYEPVAGPV